MKVFVILAFGLLAVEANLKPCFLERNKSREFLLGGFRPDCDSDGTYSELQCYEGNCYCVDKDTGIEIDGSRLKGERPKCECISPKQAGLCKASIDRWYYNRASQKCEQFDWGGCGGNSNRYDSKEQCRKSCVASRINYDDPVFLKSGGTSEKLCLKKATEGAGSSLLGVFVPTCDDDGLFKQTQCHESYCFCVHPHTGEKVAGTEVQFAKPKCEMPKCRIEHATAQNKRDKNSDTLTALLPGVFVPQCDANGNYEEVQCHDGGCFCVNTASGEELLGTRTTNGRPTVCNTPCIIERHNRYSTVQLMGLLGYILPRCTANGDYDKVQCLKDKCYCADPKTGKGIPGRYPEDCK